MTWRRTSLVLYVNGRDATVLRVRSGQVEVLQRFAPTDLGHTVDEQFEPGAFDLWLQQSNAATQLRFDILFESVDEVQHLEEVPRANRRDRQLLLARRLKQRFPDSEFCTWVRVRRDAGVMRQPTVKVLLTGLRVDDALKPWIEALLRAHVPVDRMLSPALLAPHALMRIAPALTPGISTGLLVSRHATELRQTLLINGNLKFSRVAPLVSGATGAVVAAEVKRTLHYLLNSQQLSRDLVREGAVRVWVIDEGIAHTETLPAQVELDNAGPVDVVRVTPSVLQTLRAPRMASAPGLGVWLSAALHRAGGLGLSNTRIRRFAQLAAWRLHLWMGAGALASVAVLSVLAVELLRLLEPPMPPPAPTALSAASVATVAAVEQEAAVQAAAQLMRRHVNAPQLLGRVAAALNNDEAITLTELSWGPPPADANAMGANAADATPGGATSSLLPPLRIELRGHVDAALSKAQANERVQRLAQRLMQRCGCTPVQLSLPYDPTPQASVNATLKREEAATSMSFSMVLEQNLAPAAEAVSSAADTAAPSAKTTQSTQRQDHVPRG